MSIKGDIVFLDSYKEYKKLLDARLDAHFATLHAILNSPSATLDEMQAKIIRLEALRAVIAELEQIINLPHTLEKDSPVHQNMLQHNGRSFLNMLKRAFKINRE